MKAKNVLVATNSYSGIFKPYNTFYAPLHVYTVVTKPMTKEQLDKVREWRKVRSGWCVSLFLLLSCPFSHPPLYTSKRYTLHHILWAGRITPDNRIALATGDVYYVPKDKLHAGDNVEPYAALESALASFYPGLNLEIDARWEGVIAVTLSDFPCLGTLDSKHPNVFHALAYCGHGVPLSNYSGMVIRDLFMKNQTSKLLTSDFHFIGYNQRPFPPVFKNPTLRKYVFLPSPPLHSGKPTFLYLSFIFPSRAVAATYIGLLKELDHQDNASVGLKLDRPRFSGGLFSNLLALLVYLIAWALGFLARLFT